MNATELFEQIYKKPPQYTALTPYRVCPIGAHSDHQLGKITGFAINKGIHIAYGPKENGVIEIQSVQFDKRAQWHVEATPKTKEDDWADQRGATIVLNKRYPLRRGLCAAFDGKLPIGGLFFLCGSDHHLPVRPVPPDREFSQASFEGAGENHPGLADRRYRHRRSGGRIRGDLQP